MPHHTPLIATIVAALVVAFFMGALAHRLRISPIAGYLLAGVVVGPFTPGFVADSNLAAELAEIGVILLMFGVGLHFSLRDLLSVRKIAVPGAVAQIAVAVLLGMGLAWTLGWDPLAGFVFGLALSVASTVVLLRALESRNLVQTERGRIAVGWLIVEDLAMVLALVLLPGIAAAVQAEGTASDLVFSLAGTLLKVSGFVLLMLVVGRRAIPWALHWVVHTGSRELFRLAVLAIALGVAAGAAFVFDVSFALGAFFAGMILGETPLSRRATEETLPLRDAFAVLFFVSVGMLFNPATILEQPLPLLATLAIIVIGKSVAAYLLVRAFGYDNGTALTVSGSLAQIGEFSFILVGLGVGLAILPPEAADLVLAGAILSILLHPFLFTAVAGWRYTNPPLAKVAAAASAASAAAARPAAASAATARHVEEEREENRTEHILLVGYGSVGQLVAEGFRERNCGFVLVEDQEDVALRARQAGLTVVQGNATEGRVLIEAGVERARLLLIAIPEGFEAGAIAERAKKINPALRIVARAHSEQQVQHLLRFGADKVVLGEREIARVMLSSLSRAAA
jgi:monovalent cation:H+ antiporter-2, CPA2 family